MQVFIMWAGERSHAVARELKNFLQFVVRGPRYFISDDIEGGRLWRVTLAGQLEAASFGIACMTSDNLRSHWLHFESGALSKAVGQAHVIPFLVGPKSSDIEGPLSDFQMVVADEAGTRKLVALLAAQVVDIAGDVVEKSFGFVWPDFAMKLDAACVETTSPSSEPARSDAALLQEILDRVRRMESRAEPPSRAGKVSEGPYFGVDDEMLGVMKKRAVALIDDVTSETTPPAMDDTIERWRELLARPDLSAEELLEVYRAARSLRRFLDR